MYNATRGLTEIETELQAVAAADIWRQNVQIITRDPIATKGWQAQLAREQAHLRLVAEPEELVTEMQLLDLGQEWAAVQVVVGQQGSPVAYRQTRIYLETAHGWVRTTPAVTYWGDAYELETRYFNIHYFARDAQAVEAVADQLDLLYTTLYAHFFPDLPSPDKLVIKVSPEFVPKELLPVAAQQDTLEIPSPAATLAPADISERDLLAQSLQLALLDQLAYQLEQRYELPPSGRNLSKALRLWLIWNQELPLASWQEPVVRWVLWVSPGDAAHEMSAIPEFAHDLCTHHHIWMPSPVAIGIPITCFTRAGADEEISAWRYPYTPPLQPPVPLPFDVQARGVQSEHGGQLPEPAATVVVLATMVEYVAVTFGTERLPVLLAALGEQEVQNRETLILAVFGITQEEFTDGWHTFLAQRYGIAR